MDYFSFDIQFLTPPEPDFEAGDVLNTEGGNVSDLLVGLLSDLPFETFETIETATDTEGGVRAYVRTTDWTEDAESELAALAESFDLTFEKQFLPAQNWNAIWESNFQPIRVDNFVGVRADFHPNTEGVLFDLVINPKMAFGTGHHETTYMMIQQMEALNFEGKKVLDYGCGTGVLAILASKLKATTLEAVDIELASYDNTIENCYVNDVSNVKALHGTLETVESAAFDIILGNINRNVLLASFKRLREISVVGGFLLISGFLEEDLDAMRAAFAEHNLTEMRFLQRGRWLCILLKIEEQ